MADIWGIAVAVLAVALAYFLRTIVPYLNAHTKDGSVTFEIRYLVAGATMFVLSLWQALTTFDQLSLTFEGSLAAIFITNFFIALGLNHGAFEAMDKARG